MTATTKPIKRVRLLRSIQAEPARRVRLTRRARPTPAVSIIDACRDPNLFAPWFLRTGSWKSWSAWFAFLSALFCLPMTDEQLEVYRKHTGREDPPDEISRSAALICGRRGGKSFILAVIAVYLAAFFDYRQYLVPGERGVILVIARDREQAQVVFAYIRALLTQVPMLSRMVDGEPSKESIHLTNNVSIQVATASYKSVRGRTTVAALIDELAYFPTDESGAEPDVELLAAIKPSMLTIPNSMLLVASSPYAKRGELWRIYKDHYGKNGPLLVWKATTRDMNPLVPQSEIDADLAKDPARFRAEYLTEFRDDIQALVSREVVEACVAENVHERPYERRIVYSAFCDPSGGSSDSMTLAIAHRDGENAVLDVVREIKPPFSPEAVVEEFCALLKQYRIGRVQGDKYAGEWPRERFLRFGIVYEASAKPKSELYASLLPLLNGKRCSLLDDDRLVTQIASLERRVARGGKDSIDHPPNSHDDLANVCAGALTSLVQSKYRYDVQLNNVCRKPDDPPPPSGTATAINRYVAFHGGRFW